MEKFFTNYFNIMAMKHSTEPEPEPEPEPGKLFAITSRENNRSLFDIIAAT